MLTKRETVILVAVAVAASIVVASTSPTTQPSTMTRLAEMRFDLEYIQSRMAMVDALEVQVRQLEQTISIMTPMLADRSAAVSRGDVNGDGRPDDNDLRVWSACQNVPTSQPSGACWFADVNADGKVTIADANKIKEKMGK